MRIQTKRRPPSRRHLHETTDSSPSFDNTASLQAPSNTANTGQLTDIGNITHDNHSSLSTHVSVTHRTDDVDAQSSVTDAVNSSQTHSDNSATVAATVAAVSSAQSPHSVTASVDNVVSPATPGDSSLPVDKTQVSKPSPDVDDIFADSSLFVSCKCVSYSYL